MKFLKPKKFLLLAVAVCSTLVLAGAAAENKSLRGSALDLINTASRNWTVNLGMDLMKKDMIDPAIDDGPVFSYFQRPSFTLGLRGEPFATQVIDGHLWTGAAEFMLFLGDPAAPHVQRIITLHKGYLPCIEYTVTRGTVEYNFRAFQYWLTEAGSPPVNFIRIEAKNTGSSPARAEFGAGYIYGLDDHRAPQLRQMKFNPAWAYEVKDRAALRDGKIIYAFTEKPDRVESARKVRSPEKPACVTLYTRELKPGESFFAGFALPHYPAQAALADQLASASFDERLAALENFWEGWIGQAAKIEVNEKKVMDATRSYIVHALMAQDIISGNEVEQHVNRLHYNRFWLRDSAFFVSMYEKWGYPEVAEKLLRHFFKYQREDGNFLSQNGQLDGWGQAMWALGEHVNYNGSYEFALEALPYMKRAVAWLEKALAEDPWGVMPPTDAMDNETVIGRYTGHNFWALNGLDGAIITAETAQDEDLFLKWMDLKDAYRERFLKVLRQVAADRDGVIPPGLDVPGGTSWGNLLPLYPGVQMDPFDPLVTATFDDYRHNHMQEGIATWHQSLHHYVTERVAQTALVRDEPENALADFYAMLLHTGSCHEGFEWTIFPWGNRDYCGKIAGIGTCNYPPHGWYAADMLILFRNMLIREQGRELHLASAISPEWAKPGDVIKVGEAPSYFWHISYTFSFAENSAVFHMAEPGWCACHAPHRVILHLPWFVNVTTLEMNGSAVAVPADNRLELPADSLLHESGQGCTVKLTFTRKDVPEMNYLKAVEDFKAEYRRRWEESR